MCSTHKRWGQSVVVQSMLSCTVVVVQHTHVHVGRYNPIKVAEVFLQEFYCHS